VFLLAHEPPTGGRALTPASNRSHLDVGVGTERVGLLTVGQHLPDFELLDHAGNRRRLSALVGGDPTVVQFYRGWWCPKEQAFFRRLLALQEDAEVAYSRILSISVDLPQVNAAFRAGLGARWTFLSDPNRELQTQLRLRETTDTLNDPYVPAVVVIDPDLCINATYNGYWYWGRPTHEELVRDLREISRALRVDWEAPTP
jgi:peroxiredoxin